MTTHDNSPPPSLAQVLESDLMTRFGPLIGQEDLRRALGYPTMDAFRQALARKQLPVAVFALPRRHGKYALVKDVAVWLAERRATADIRVSAHPSNEEEVPMP